MKPVDRTLDFIAGKPVDCPPFHPIIMQFAAEYAKIPYSRFCLDPHSKVSGMIKCAEDFDLDWVTVMSDPYAEAEAFGLAVEYPENSLPKNIGHLINDISDINNLKLPRLEDSPRMMARVKEVEEYSRRVGDKYFIVGWAEGPLAEYVDLRGLSDACLDLFDYEADVNRAFDVIMENAFQLIKAQADAGAHCIGVGDAACSQVGPDLYRSYVFAREKALVDYAHSLGVKVKLHICGNTIAILPDMISTGADIIDVDHLVADMSPFIPLLSGAQVLSGNSDPVEVVMRGTAEDIAQSVRECARQTAGRGIVSAGCEIPLQTSIENFRAYSRAARGL
jgi:uroporphyrinogen decarboxylase